MNSSFWKTIKNERFILYGVIVIMAITLVFFLEKNYHHRFSPPQKSSQTHVSVKDQPIVMCAKGDTSCESKNQTIMLSRLSGSAVDYAKHQCDGPRACEAPIAALEKSNIDAIRTYTKDPQLSLLRVAGVTATGLTYYCAADNRCWSVDKELYVTLIITETKPSTASKTMKSK